MASYEVKFTSSSSSRVYGPQPTNNQPGISCKPQRRQAPGHLCQHAPSRLCEVKPAKIQVFGGAGGERNAFCMEKLNGCLIQ